MNNQLLEKIVAWAKNDINVLALIATGSYARGAGATDKNSDYDLEIIAQDAVKLARNDEWLHRFGNVWVSQYFDEDQPYPTRLVYYEGGQKVDFTLADRKRLTDMVEVNKLDGMYERGYTVLLDKAGVTTPLPVASGAYPIRSLPGENEFADAVNEFWFEAAHLPKYLIREDLWVVKLRDWTMKEMLLKMLEWHALAMQNGKIDVWHIGSKMKMWTASAIWDELGLVYGHFDRQDSWRSLLATCELFDRLTRETAEKCDIDYPAEVAGNILGYIHAQSPEITGVD